MNKVTRINSMRSNTGWKKKFKTALIFFFFNKKITTLDNIYDAKMYKFLNLTMIYKLFERTDNSRRLISKLYITFLTFKLSRLLSK